MKAIMNPGRWPAALVLAAVLAAAPECVRALVTARHPLPASNPTLAPQPRRTYRPSNVGPSAQLNVRAQPVHTPRPQGIPYDWSHRHLIFSQPSSAANAQWLEQEPRYRMQQAWRHRQAVAGSAEAYMQALDALAMRLATARKLPILPPLKRGKRFPKMKKIPVGAWGQSLSVTVNNPNGTASYPAKFAFTDSTSCTDWVTFTVPIVGTSSGTTGQFNIFAFKNLYSSVCSGTPTLKFAYNASSVGGKLLTAPVLSLSGDQIAFIEAGSTAFHVLKFKDGDPIPTFPNPSNSSSPLATCGTAPCEYSFSWGASATLSAPFYDYTTSQDTAYVSDDAAGVWAIKPVFSGTPQKKTGWTNGVIVNTSNPDKVTAPVYDPVSQNVFVGDQLGNLYYVRTQNSSSGTCNGLTTGAPCLGDTSTTASCTGNGTPQACCTALHRGCQFLNVSNKPIIEPVIVDSNTGKVFAFSNGFPSGFSSGSYVVQTDVTLSIMHAANIGSGTTNVIIHPGAFDDKYYSDPTTGSLYVCGQNASGVPQLYAFGFTNSPTSGTMNTTAVSGAPIPLATTSTSTQCSPLTEDKSGSTDRLFLAVAAGCPATGATSAGCVESFDITSGFPSLTVPPYSGSGFKSNQNTTLGTSTGTAGIIIDNLSGTTDQTNIYFETQGSGTGCSTYNGGTASGSCAVSLTQSGLQ